jgi:competence protein ComEA
LPVSGLINPNQATVEDLDKGLLGIGPKKAQAIVDFRKENGPFKTLDELTQVKGISQKTIKKNESRLFLD